MPSCEGFVKWFSFNRNISHSRLLHKFRDIQLWKAKLNTLGFQFFRLQYFSLASRKELSKSRAGFKRSAVSVKFRGQRGDQKTDYFFILFDGNGLT